MKINKLKIKNFKQYKDCTISFPEGLTGLIGKNGAGKSTIFEAIYLALYGKYKYNKDKMRNDNAKSNEPIEVELSFEENNNSYRIKRKYTGINLTPNAELFINDEENASIFGANEVTKKITRLLKIDSKNFKNSFFSEQKEVTALLDMKGNERQVQFRIMLGLQKLDKLEDRIKDKKSETDKELNALSKILLTDSQIEQLKNDEENLHKELKVNEEKEIIITQSLNNLQTLYNTIKSQIQIEEEKEREVNKITKNIISVEERISASTKNLLDYKKTINERLENKNELINISSFKDEYEKSLIKYSELLKQKTDYANKINLEKSITEKMESEKELDSEIIPLQNTINSFIDIEKEKERITKEFNHVKELIQNKEELKTEIKKRYDLVESEIAKLNKYIKKLNNLGIDSPCPECNRPLGEEYYNKMLTEYQLNLNKFEIDKEEIQLNLKNINDEIELLKQKNSDLLKGANLLVETENDLKNKKQNLEYLEKRVSKIKNEISVLQNDYENYKNISFNENELNEVEIKKNELKPYAEKYIKLQTLVKQIPEIQQKITDTEELINKLNKELLLLKSNKDIIKFEETSLIELRNERDAKVKELTKVNNEKTEITININNVKNSIKSITKTLNDDAKKRIEKEAIETRIKTFNKLVDFIKEFKIKLQSKELPIISQSADKLFTEITKGRYSGLRIDPDFNFYINRDGIDVPVETLSGGEKDLASICLRIAISKRIAALCGRKNMGFLALDEVFGSQDKNRREDLVNTLQVVSNDFKQIFIVTHNQDVDEVFPNKLLVQLKGNYSVAELI